jgi:drug/metabolite transporter (DMT)-like permease
MARSKVLLLTAFALLAFAANSLLCRLALRSDSIDPALFTLTRIAAGAIALWLILRVRKGRLAGNWISALALFAYAIAFSLAYASLTAATGALLLFGAVQVTMIGYGITRGERLTGVRLAGFLLAALGLAALLLPGLSRPPLAGSLLMVCAGAAWGVYSLRGKGASDPLAVTAGNFAWAVIPALLTGLTTLPHPHYATAGILYALLSGALASGVGYAVWYTALGGLSATEAATVQLSVPVIAAAAGVLLLGEQLSARLVVCALVILSGIALALKKPYKSSASG